MFLDEPVLAHRLVLSSASPRFRNLLASGQPEDSMAKIDIDLREIPNSVNAFKAMLSGLYTGELNFSLAAHAEVSWPSLSEEDSILHLHFLSRLVSDTGRSKALPSADHREQAAGRESGIQPVPCILSTEQAANNRPESPLYEQPLQLMKKKDASLFRAELPAHTSRPLHAARSAGLNLRRQYDTLPNDLILVTADTSRRRHQVRRASG